MDDTESNGHSERQSAIERELARTDQRIEGLEEKTETILSGQNLLFKKFDNLMSAVSALKAGNGLVSSHMILTTIGVLTPVIIAATLVGYYFVLQVQAKDELRFRIIQDQASKTAESTAKADVFAARLDERIIALKEIEALREKLRCN